MLGGILAFVFTVCLIAYIMKHLEIKDKSEPCEKKEGSEEKYLKLNPEECLPVLSSEISEMTFKVSVYLTFAVISLTALSLLILIWGGAVDLSKFSTMISIHINSSAIFSGVALAVIIYLTAWSVNDAVKTVRRNRCMDTIRDAIINKEITKSEQIFEKWARCRKYQTLWDDIKDRIKK